MLRGIVRIAGKDMKGQQELSHALTEIRGVGHNLANAFCKPIERELGIPPTTKVGSLSDNQIASIEEILRNPAKHGVLVFLLNRQRDDETGEQKHVIQSDLQFAVRQDVEKEKTMRTWIGWRHSIGQKVRGQHNRTTGRTGITVGVLKKAIKEQKVAAAKAAQEKAPASTTEKK